MFFSLVWTCPLCMVVRCPLLFLELLFSHDSTWKNSWMGLPIFVSCSTLIAHALMSLVTLPHKKISWWGNCRWHLREGRSGGVRPSSPPRHDTTAPGEPTPRRVQPPRQAKTKDADFHYTKWGLHLATTDFIGLARAWSYRSIFSFISHFRSPHVFKRAFAYFLLSLLGLGGGFPLFRDPSKRPFPFVNLISFYEYGCGLWASSGPFPLLAHHGLYKRGRDPPTNPSRHLRKEGFPSRVAAQGRLEKESYRRRRRRRRRTRWCRRRRRYLRRHSLP